MRGLDELPGPIVVCVPADAPPKFDDDQFGQCALCGASVRFRPEWPGQYSFICLLCFLVHAEDVPTC
jgi:hypothetical protein